MMMRSVIKTEKKKPFIINRQQHRWLRSLSKDELIKWLHDFYCEVYNEAISETYLAVFRQLHDYHGWTNEQMENLFYDSNEDIEAINQHYVTPEEIRQGLFDEGVKFLGKFKCMG